ncbi:unnamed protein product [Strongylus vulgaris]|uniref:Laminin G domain-containing protein n=1 Tax=Strongylus vulgaris TaxID=40348 RepID=A0A3P7LHG8_STRVU|nr:unnamed protein product [Strongylus vulgaris]
MQKQLALLKDKINEAREKAQQVRDKRIVAHWNVGGGAKMATNSHSILYIPNTDRSNWYHIDTDTGSYLRRAIWNVLKIFLMIIVVSDYSSVKKQDDFHGVIGGITVDGVSLPLWAFSGSSPECEGAPAPPQPTVRGYMFRDGFAQMELATFERTVSSISVIFNAYSPNGLLYFRGSETSGDFIALQLKDGHVVFKINLGGSSHAELTSKNPYADGREHTVKAIRSGGEIHLQVDSDADRFSTTIPGENTALNIETDMHYVAGVPSSFRIDRFDANIEWKGFFGCILSVKPSQASDLNLDHPVRWQRREPGCHFSAAKLVPTDRLVGFSRPGYLLQKGVIMDNNSTFGFGFRTKEENGTLIFQSSKLSAFRRKQRGADNNGKGYMAFYLFRGYLVLHFGKVGFGQTFSNLKAYDIYDASSRKEVVTIRSSQMYNDGQLHSVFMSFAERSKPPNNEIPITVPLIGCVSDMFHNYRKIPIVPEEHNAQIGICAIESPNFATPIGWKIPIVPEEHNAQIGICAIESPNFATPIDEPLDLDSIGGHRKDSRLNHQMDRNYYGILCV